MKLNGVSVILMVFCILLNAVACFSKGNRTKWFVRYLTIAIGLTGLFITRLYLNYEPLLMLALSIPIGYILYILSLFIVGTRLNKKNLFPSEPLLNRGLIIYRRKELLRNLKSSLVEELVYRGLIQYTLTLLLPFPFLAAALSAVYFTAIHYRKKIARIQMIDVFAFTIAVTAVFQITLNLYAVIIIHIVRNTFVILQKYIHVQDERARRRGANQITKELRNNESKV